MSAEGSSRARASGESATTMSASGRRTSSGGEDSNSPPVRVTILGRSTMTLTFRQELARGSSTGRDVSRAERAPRDHSHFAIVGTQRIGTGLVHAAEERAGTAVLGIVD